VLQANSGDDDGDGAEPSAPEPLTTHEAVDALRRALSREADVHVRQVVTVEQMLAPSVAAVTHQLQLRAVELPTPQAACE
jgi:hypothetical protein